MGLSLHRRRGSAECRRALIVHGVVMTINEIVVDILYCVAVRSCSVPPIDEVATCCRKQ